MTTRSEDFPFERSQAVDRPWHDLQDFVQPLSGAQESNHWWSALGASFSRKPRSLWIGGLLVLIVILVALFAPWLAKYLPDAMLPDARLLSPSLIHPFGTDSFGRDLFSRVIYGSRLALRLCLLSVLLSALPGILLGLAAGYLRGWVDQVLSRLIDAWLALPGLLLALLVIARTGPSQDGVILALGLTGIPAFYRLVRAGTLSIFSLPYIEASRALGASGWRIVFTHILPNLLTNLIVLVTLRMGMFILAGSSLSFIGLGSQPPAPEWGALLSEGRDFMDTAWWMFFFPLLAITITVIGLNLLGDGLRDWFADRGR